MIIESNFSEIKLFCFLYVLNPINKGVNGANVYEDYIYYYYYLAHLDY